MSGLGLKLRILARAEMTLFKIEARRRANTAVLAGISAGCALIALLFLNVGLFFLLAEEAAYAKAGFILSGGNLVLAVVPLLLRPRGGSAEEQAVREIREMAFNEASTDLDALSSSVSAVGETLGDVRSFVSGLGGGAAGSMGPLMSLLLTLFKRLKKD